MTWLGALTLAEDAGLFKKHGLDVTIKMIPQKDHHLAIASGDIQCGHHGRALDRLERQRRRDDESESRFKGDKLALA